ncbi:MAG: MaoC family dehydratase N-terminal domain-containing protein [Chloroflexota bacterium]|nr:MaoC family dehydratase N-terminal domain-containing protein [Chloroflexota bacterium]
MPESVLTPEIKALIDKAGEVVEGWHAVDEEYLRRLHQALPDWDPRYWDEELAKKTMFRKRVIPPMLAYLCLARKAPFGTRRDGLGDGEQLPQQRRRDDVQRARLAVQVFHPPGPRAVRATSRFLVLKVVVPVTQ